MSALRAMLLLLVVLAFGGSGNAPEPKNGHPFTLQAPQMTQNELLGKLIGKWEGTSRTWDPPGELADDSEVAGEFANVLDGRFVRHTYEGSFQGKPRHGEELIAFNSVAKTFQSSWVDDFHMNYAIMFSQGESTERGFKVRGEYDDVMAVLNQEIKTTFEQCPKAVFAIKILNNPLGD